MSPACDTFPAVFLTGAHHADCLLMEVCALTRVNWVWRYNQRRRKTRRQLKDALLPRRAAFRPSSLAGTRLESLTGEAAVSQVDS